MILLYVFISSLKPEENSICCVSTWVRAEKGGKEGCLPICEPPAGCDREDW